MKVLVIHTKYKYSGGEDTVVDEEINLLRSKGIIVDVLYFNNVSNSFLKLLQLFFNYKSYRIAVNKIDLFKPDIVHIHNLHFGASASVIYAIMHKKIPFVKTLHNYRLICPSGTLFQDGKLFLDSVKKKFPWKAVKLGVYKNSRLITFWLSFSIYLHNKLGTWRNCDRYIVLSEFAKNLFLNSHLNLKPTQFIIKPNFVSPQSLKLKEKEEHFLYIGRLTEEKGIKFLISAFAKSTYKIKIVGDGPLKNLVVEYSKKYNNIVYLPSVSKPEVYELMQACSALVFPSIWYEGMPLTIIEAFACNTIVIASKLGAMNSMIEPGYNGYLFEPQNENELIACLNAWHNLDNSQKRLQRMNSYKTYEEFYTPQKNIEQLLSVYKQVIEEKL